MTLSLVLTHSIEADKTEKDKNYSIKKRNNPVGEITIEVKDSKKKAIFKLEDSEKKKRLGQILGVLKNGLIYHSSGENEGIVPMFMIAAGLKVPIPLFNSYVELGSFESSIMKNGYIFVNSNKKMVYIYNPKNLVGNIDTTNLYTEWDCFLKDLGVKTNNGTNQTSPEN
ncbi:CRISPR-associated negative autoregulator [Thermodesulfovibrio sp. N1]|nr:CRISPR-associated negative autoregulator [Thermodesulfovibrio sp. N1]